MADKVQAPLVTGVLSLSTAVYDGTTDCLVLTVLLENGKSLSLPIPWEHAARVAGLLTIAMRERGVEIPTKFVRKDEIQ